MLYNDKRTVLDTIDLAISELAKFLPSDASTKVFDRLARAASIMERSLQEPNPKQLELDFGETEDSYNN